MKIKKIQILKMELPLNLLSEKPQKCHSNKAPVRSYMENGICTDKNLYGKPKFHVAAVDNRWVKELLNLEENFATNPCSL